jgi:hypothetical protein
VEPESEDDGWQSAMDGDRMSVDLVVDIIEPAPARESVPISDCTVLTEALAASPTRVRSRAQTRGSPGSPATRRSKHASGSSRKRGHPS